jgi:hypothetical protein
MNGTGRIEATRKGVTAHPLLRSTSNPAVFAADGAAASAGQPLTPVAMSISTFAAVRFSPIRRFENRPEVSI